MANSNKDNNELFFVIGGIIAAIAGVLGVGYLANKDKDKDNGNIQTQVQRHGIEPKTSSGCNKCPFSK